MSSQSSWPERTRTGSPALRAAASPSHRLPWLYTLWFVLPGEARSNFLSLSLVQYQTWIKGIPISSNFLESLVFFQSRFFKMSYHCYKIDYVKRTLHQLSNERSVVVVVVGFDVTVFDSIVTDNVVFDVTVFDSIITDNVFFIVVVVDVAVFEKISL